MLDRKAGLVSILFALCFLAHGGAIAAALRTFVSGSGVDTNPCTLTLPCRTFATAITQTFGAGEVIVLDSGGYGPVTITQSVSIIAPKGVYAGINLSGVTVQGAGINVLLRGLTINGQGGGSFGIGFSQGARLAIEDCEISGMGSGGIFAFAPGAVLTITDTVVRNSGGTGITVGGDMGASIVRVRAESNHGAGIEITDGAQVSIDDSVAVDNSAGVLATNFFGGTTTKVTVAGLVARGNDDGVVSSTTISSATTVVHVARSNLSQNKFSGMQVCCSDDGGTATASITDSHLTSNGNRGVLFEAPSAASVLTVGGNRILDSGVGIDHNIGGGTVYTRSDNTIVPQVTSGTLTPLGSL